MLPYLSIVSYLDAETKLICYHIIEQYHIWMLKQNSSVAISLNHIISGCWNKTHLLPYLTLSYHNTFIETGVPHSTLLAQKTDSTNYHHSLLIAHLSILSACLSVMAVTRPFCEVVASLKNDPPGPPYSGELHEETAVENDNTWLEWLHSHVHAIEQVRYRHINSNEIYCGFCNENI